MTPYMWYAVFLGTCFLINALLDKVRIYSIKEVQVDVEAKLRYIVPWVKLQLWISGTAYSAVISVYIEGLLF